VCVGTCNGEHAECAADCAPVPVGCDQVECGSDADCGHCDDADKCNGGWVCGAEGYCMATEPVDCSHLDNGCASGYCQASTGECNTKGNHDLCNDDDWCTYDYCQAATGECSNSETEMGCGGDTHPCQTSNLPGGSNDPHVNHCVCVEHGENWCCDGNEGGWGAWCVALAQEHCELECNINACTDAGCDDEDPCTMDTCGDDGVCANTPIEGCGEPGVCVSIACEGDADCGQCGDTDKCNGEWLCADDGYCTATEPVDCSDLTVGCITGQCNAATGACSTSANHAMCTDDDWCTYDYCNSGTGECVNNASNDENPDEEDWCGADQHPCQTSNMPGGSNDPAINACVCVEHGHEWCCAESWNEECIGIAQEVCGLACNIAGCSPELCNDDNSCTIDGCSDDGACTHELIDDCGGECAEGCDDGSACTTDACIDGVCVNTLMEGCGTTSGTSPCEVNPNPGGSNNLEINQCLCGDYDMSGCCTEAWSAACVSMAREVCDVPCDSCQDDDGVAAPEVSCETDADCWPCQNTDQCDGSWSCGTQGICVPGEPKDCSELDGGAGSCLVGACENATGECYAAWNQSLCDTGTGWCTNDWCAEDTGMCMSEPIEGCNLEGGPNSPCEVNPGPGGSNDPAINDWLCGIEGYLSCCTATWDTECVAAAREQCGVPCDSCHNDGELLDVDCESDADCWMCQNADLCDGAWTCSDENLCVQGDPVDCSELNGDVVDDEGVLFDGSCIVGMCQTSTGACYEGWKESLCDTGSDWCTKDWCAEDTGMCMSQPIEGCSIEGGPHSPCEVNPGSGGSNDSAVNGCVCGAGGDLSCCTDTWDTQCIAMAREQCDVPCDSCHNDGELLDVGCESDADCWMCQNADLCDGSWSCGTQDICVPGEPKDCSELDGGAGSCLVGACQNATGECYAAWNQSLCEDGDWCTDDWCEEDTGMCMSQPVDLEQCNTASCVDGTVSTCGCPDGTLGERLCEDQLWGLCACATDPACTEGAVQACGCDDGTEGTQSCDGEGWGPCVCEAWCGDALVTGSEACDDGGATALCDADCQEVTSFISVWETAADGETVTLPLATNGTYDFTVDWGDGSEVAEVTAHDDLDITHTYVTAGQYTVTIDGLITRVAFIPDSLAAQQLISIPNLGHVGWTNFDHAFYGCDRLTTVAGGDTSQVFTMQDMFHAATLATPDTSGWDTSKVSTTYRMFRYARAATPDTSGWDTSNVVNMREMFQGAFLANPDTSGWNTSKVLDMKGMFNGAIVANPDTSGWDTSQVTNISWIFMNASAATPDTSGWDTSQVTDMSAMFANAVAANPDTSNWDTSKVADMFGMFGGAVAANPDTSGWDTSNVTSMQGMFQGASVANPDTSGWDTSNVTIMQSMFQDASVANPDTSGWDTSNVTNMMFMFAEASSASPDMSGWDFANVEHMFNMFEGIDIGEARYSDLLVALAAQNEHTDVRLGGGLATYNEVGAVARAILVDDRGWTITDGGPAP
jgi:surface protein